MKRHSMVVSLILSAILSSSCSIFDSGSSNSGSSNDASSDSSSQYGNETTINLYSINDFHGAIVQNQYSEEMGLLSLGTFLKNEGKKENTLLISSGDMFQGSLESNWNKGRFLTDAMDIIGFDAFTLGNHEFDWGQENLAALAARNEYSYKTPWLSSNVYKWDDVTKSATNERVDKFGDLYSTKVLENGLKIGFVGAIGSDQWTSITSNNVNDITFADPISIVKEVSDTLKAKEKCDLVFLTYHGAQDQILGQGLTDVSPVSKKKYVDTVFCGHTHTSETATENGVVFTQNNSNGRNVSKITLTIDSNKNVAKSIRRVLSWENIVTEIGSDYDKELEDCYNEYVSETETVGSEVLGKLDGDFGSDFANLVADAMLEESLNEGYDPVVAITNSVRAYPEEGNMTYANLMKSVPFENKIVICKVKGSEIKKETSYNTQYIAKNPNFTGTIVNTKTYVIACIDYLAYHMNTNHEYNYFPSFQKIDELKKDGQAYEYREITADYIRSKKTVSALSYSSSNSKFDKSSL